MSEKLKIRRALLSVTNKERLEEIAALLTQNEVEIISSGGTRKYLEEKGFAVTDIQKVTGNPEAFGGRMKTLSFQVSSGILYRRGHEEDEKQILDLDIKPIDLIVVNLYEFEKTKAQSNDFDEWIEAIDIGGPTMLRAAAKNFEHVMVLPSVESYQDFINDYQNNNGQVSIDLRMKTATETFNLMAKYDLAIARAFQEKISGVNLEQFNLDVTNRKILRYGENPHQRGMVVVNKEGLASTDSLQGKQLSYNNYLDADAALTACRELTKVAKHQTGEQYCVTVVKHGNACGQSISKNHLQSIQNAWAGDPISAFGGIICSGHEIGLKEAEFFQDKFIELLMAPSFTKEARDFFSKKKNLRIMEIDCRKTGESQ